MEFNRVQWEFNRSSIGVQWELNGSSIGVQWELNMSSIEFNRRLMPEAQWAMVCDHNGQ